MFDICAELKRIAKVIVAVYSEEFERFDEIFNQTLSNNGISSQEILSATESDFGNAKDIAHEGLKILRDIGDFLKSRTWNFYNANKLYEAADALAEKINDEYIMSANPDEVGKLSKICDFLISFVESLRKYMDSQDETLESSQFVSAVKSLREFVGIQPWEHLDGIGTGTTGFFNGYSGFMKAGKEIMEMLNQAHNSSPDERKTLLESVREKCRMIPTFYPFYYSSFIGSWRRLGQNTYSPKVWGLILANCKTKMEKGIFSYFKEIDSACAKFLSSHDKEVEGERSLGKNWKINFKDDAKSFLSKVSTSYVGLVRSLNSGVFEYGKASAMVSRLESAFNELSDEFAKL